MKKTILILLSLIMLSGCSITRVDNYDYKQLMNKVLSFNINYYNKIGNGYKYYAPRGITKVNSSDYNDVLRRSNRTYYLYVDVVSYYYKIDVNYKVDNNLYYSALINNDEKQGYIEIEKNKDKLYVCMFYNYAKIETYVEEKDLKESVADMSYILSSISFNDSLLNKMYEAGNFDSKDEVYKLFDNKEKEGNFLEYIKEYDKYDGSEEEKDELIIDKKETTTTTTTQKQTTTTIKVEDEITTSTSE